MKKEMFSGLHYLILDSNGRVSIPSLFREILKNTYKNLDVVIAKAEDVFITVYPLTEWKKFAGGRQCFSKASKKSYTIEGCSYSLVSKSKIDNSGRIKIPNNIIKSLKLGKDIIIVGGGQYFFEIWNKTDWNRFFDDKQSTYEDI